MRDARQLVLRIGRVYVDEPEIRELQRHDAPFGIQIRAAQAMQHLQRRLFRKHGRAGIPLLLRTAPEFMVAGQVHVHLSHLEFRLLQREHVGIEFREYLVEPLAQNRAQPVHGP